MFDWNDLKYFLAIARHGSTIAAGKALRISQSTVQRRLVELEKQINRKLVMRTAAGYRLTDSGQELLPYAERTSNGTSVTRDATTSESSG
jgi:DNA-binding transcriptional LysR family regulator